ncbi:MAG: LacI family DNA-binding transcriptional regulator [Marmoricola sp.]
MTRVRKPTLSDVAARAGVSTTTASYILNGRSESMRISPETRTRVLEAIEALAYRPNRNARSLRTSKTSTIGIITDFVAGGIFSSQMLSGANLAARAADHLLVIGESEGDAAARDLLIDEMLDRQVDGIIYATRTALRTPLPPRLRGTRVVMLNCHDPASDVAFVMPDDVDGGRLAARILLDAGYTAGISLVGETPEESMVAGRRRIAGLEEVLGAAGVTVVDQVVCDWAPDPAYDAVDAWLAAGAVPQALICMNDRAAIGTYQALRTHGLSVPDDVSVVSFDGSEVASWVRPRLTSVALPFREMGARAVQLLLGDAGVRAGLVPMTIQVGESVRTRRGPSRRRPEGGSRARPA